MHYDLHVHSEVSPDSKMPPQNAVNALAAKGMGICFTEHVDYLPKGNMDESYPHYGKNFNVDFEAYPERYAPLRCETVLLGYEIGMTEEFNGINRKHAAHPALDFVLGSIHWADGYDLAYGEKFYAAFGTEVFRKYLQYSLKMVEQNEYIDAFGHIDYVSRYAKPYLPPGTDVNVWYENYPDEYDALLKTLALREIPMEICTRRFAEEQARKCMHGIYKRYHALGGRFVTIGSDAHREENLGCFFEEALVMAKEIGLKPVYFRERKMVIPAASGLCPR
jgi:histidinol-phosphatase (PHP family)